MAADPQDGQTKRYILMRTLMDVGMGIIYIGAALFLSISKKFFEPPFNYVFGGILFAYGLFRIYRGVKKNYFRS